MLGKRGSWIVVLGLCCLFDELHREKVSKGFGADRFMCARVEGGGGGLGQICNDVVPGSASALWLLRELYAHCGTVRPTRQPLPSHAPFGGHFPFLKQDLVVLTRSHVDIIGCFYKVLNALPPIKPLA